MQVKGVSEPKACANAMAIAVFPVDKIKIYVQLILVQ